MHKQTLQFSFLSSEYFKMYFLRYKFLLFAILEIFIENFMLLMFQNTCHGKSPSETDGGLLIW
jgi:hypothetical protein